MPRPRSAEEPLADPDIGRSSYEMRLEEIRSSLADICVRVRWDSFSVYRLLNRVLFMIQAPLAFAICRCEPATDFAVLDHRTVNDPLFEAEFMKALEGVGFNVDDKRAAFSQIQDSAIRIFTTHYYIIPFKVERLSEPKCTMQKIAYFPLSPDDPARHYLRDCFAPFGRCLKELRIEDHLERHFDELIKKTTILRAPYDRPDGNAPTDVDLDYLEGPRNRLKSLLLKEMERFEQSPILCKTPYDVPNFLLSIKSFDRRSVRFGNYFYNVSFILSDQQKERLVRFFEKKIRPHMISFSIKSLDDWFWQHVRNSEIQELFDTLESPLSQGARTFVEYSLMSGTSIVNCDPFSRGDVGWFEAEHVTDHSQREREREKALRLFVVLHYVLQAMAPGVNDPVVLTLPIRASGANWITVSTVRGSKEDPQRPGIVDSDEFQIRFRFYHSLMREFEGRLRRKSKDYYLNEVGRIFGKAVEVRMRKPSNMTGERREQRVNLTDEDFLDVIDKVHTLCRVYPYEPIHFGPKGMATNIPNYEGSVLGNALQIDFGIVLRNPYFDRLQLRPFLAPEPTREKLSFLIYATVGRRPDLKIVAVPGDMPNV
jgi:hypothetical protein